MREVVVLPLLLFSFASEYAIVMAEVTKVALKLNGANSLVVSADYVKLLDEDMHAVKGITDTPSVDS